MKPIKIEHTISSKLLTKLFSEYVDSKGYPLSNLNNHRFTVVRDYELPLSKVTNKVKSFDTIHYFKELEVQGFLLQSDTSYRLTLDGYTQGFKQKHPIKYFFREHWKIYTGFILTMLIVVVGLMNFLKTN